MDVQDEATIALRPTRRRFLKQSLAGVAAAAGLDRREARADSESPEQEVLRRLAAEYGSELGAFQRVGR